MNINLKTKMFTFTFRPEDKIKAPTEIYVPRFQYPYGYLVDTSSGRVDRNTENQTLLIHDAKGDTVTVKVMQKK